MTSPRPQISQREPVKPKLTPVAPVTTPVSTAAVKEPVSTTKKIHLKILISACNERQRELAANRANTDI